MKALALELINNKVPYKMFWHEIYSKSIQLYYLLYTPLTAC